MCVLTQSAIIIWILSIFFHKPKEGAEKGSPNNEPFSKQKGATFFYEPFSKQKGATFFYEPFSIFVGPNTILLLYLLIPSYVE